MQKYVPLCNKLKSLSLGGQRIDQKRKKGWWRGRRERIVPQGAFFLSFRLDSAVKRSSSEALKLSFQRSCSVKGLARRD